MVVVEGVARKLYPDTNIWNVSRPVLEDWLQDLKGPKARITSAIDTSTEILKEYQIFQNLWIKLIMLYNLSRKVN